MTDIPQAVIAEPITGQPTKLHDTLVVHRPHPIFRESPSRVGEIETLPEPLRQRIHLFRESRSRLEQRSVVDEHFRLSGHEGASIFRFLNDPEDIQKVIETLSFLDDKGLFYLTGESLRSLERLADFRDRIVDLPVSPLERVENQVLREKINLRVQGQLKELVQLVDQVRNNRIQISENDLLLAISSLSGLEAVVAWIPKLQAGLPIPEFSEFISPELLKKVLDFPSRYPELPNTFASAYELLLAYQMYLHAHHPNATGHENITMVDQDELITPLMEYISDHRDNYTYLLTGDAIGSGKEIVDEMTGKIGMYPELHPPFIKYLAAQRDDEKMRYLLGIFVDQTSFPHVINLIRSILLDQSLSPEILSRLERAGKMLLGANPDDPSIPFHTSLESVYQAVNFAQYKPNIYANERELALIEREMQRLRQPIKNIYDVACGIGRLAKNIHPAGIGRVIGIDISAPFLQQAARDVQGEGNRSTFVQADWTKLPLAPRSAKLIVCLGRSLPHTENRKRFAKVMANLVDLLQDDGELLFDMPNPNRGHYLVARQKYLEFLENSGIPVRERWGETALEHIEYVIDGPDAENLYNRYVPQIQTIESISESLGCEVEIIARSPIDENSEDENLYFRVRKKKPNASPLHQPRPDQTRLS